MRLEVFSKSPPAVYAGVAPLLAGAGYGRDGGHHQKPGWNWNGPEAHRLVMAAEGSAAAFGHFRDTQSTGWASR